MVSQEDQRGDLRGVRQERLFVKVKSCDTDPELQETTIGCTTKDVSASGMQLLIAQALPEQTELEIWAEIKGVPGKFLLHGQVRWNIERSEQEFICGVELNDELEASDLKEWQDLFM